MKRKPLRRYLIEFRGVAKGEIFARSVGHAMHLFRKLLGQGSGNRAPQPVSLLDGTWANVSIHSEPA